MVSTGENTVWRIIGVVFLYLTIVIPIIIYYSLLDDVVASCPGVPQPDNFFDIFPFMILCTVEALASIIIQLIFILIVVIFVWLGIHAITFFILLFGKIWKSTLLLLILGFFPILVTWIFFITEDVFSNIDQIEDLIIFIPLILNTILLLIGLALRLFTSDP